MVINILSAKYMEETSVWTPFTRPTACFVEAGKEEASTPLELIARFWMSDASVGVGILSAGLYVCFPKSLISYYSLVFSVLPPC